MDAAPGVGTTFLGLVAGAVGVVVAGVLLALLNLVPGALLFQPAATSPSPRSGRRCSPV